MNDAFTEPLRLLVVEGAVVIVGPGGLAGALTPEAAEESARLLLAAAVHCRQMTPDNPDGKNDET